MGVRKLVIEVNTLKSRVFTFFLSAASSLIHARRMNSTSPLNPISHTVFDNNSLNSTSIELPGKSQASSASFRSRVILGHSHRPFTLVPTHVLVFPFHWDIWHRSLVPVISPERWVKLAIKTDTCHGESSCAFFSVTSRSVQGHVCSDRSIVAATMSRLLLLVPLYLYTYRGQHLLARS